MKLTSVERIGRSQLIPSVRHTQGTVHVKRDDLLSGALLSLAHSASLLEAAAILYGEGHYTSCFLLSIAAREELGRFVLLAGKGRGLAPDDTVDPLALKKELDDHIVKLQAGQGAVPVPMPPAWVEDWRRAIESQDATRMERLGRQRQSAARSVRKREPHDTHARRERSQYVDPQADGSWNDPGSISAEQVRSALMAGAAEVANALIRIQGAQELHAAGAQAHLELPDMGGFTTRVFARMAQRGA